MNTLSEPSPRSIVSSLTCRLLTARLKFRRRKSLVAHCVIWPSDVLEPARGGLREQSSLAGVRAHRILRFSRMDGRCRFGSAPHRLGLRTVAQLRTDRKRARLSNGPPLEKVLSEKFKPQINRLLEHSRLQFGAVATQAHPSLAVGHDHRGPNFSSAPPSTEHLDPCIF